MSSYFLQPSKKEFYSSLWKANSPPFQLDACEWVQCIEPPVPEGSNLKTDYNGSNPYAFGDNATYMPSEPGLYFEGDRNQG